MQESVQDINAIRHPAVAVGLLAGFGVGYLMAYFTDIAASPPLFYWGLMIMFLPFIVLGIIILLLWTRKPLSLSDSRTFVLSFWGPFFSLYVATTILYWLVRM